MAEYKPEELRKLQLTELEILKDIIEICDNNKLNYFMTSGCAIGIERHQGFIPWDDDIDLGIMRGDYYKLIDIIEREYSDKYRILNFEKDKNFPFPHTNIIKKGTVCQPEMFSDLKVRFGIDVALYPFDNISDNQKLRKKQEKWLFIYQKLLMLREIKKPFLTMPNFQKGIVLFCCYCAHYLMKLFCISKEWLFGKYMKWATMFNNIETKEVCCFFSTKPFDMKIERNDLFPLDEKLFEGIMVKIPKENHKYLTQMYGDYMQLPPLDKRKNHAPEHLDFGE